MSDTSLIERYLVLGLRLGKLVPGFVDAYYGPPELAARVDGEPSPDPQALADEAARLLDELDGTIADEQRRRWLRAQLVGLETVGRRLAGEPISYVDEVERCSASDPRSSPRTSSPGHTRRSPRCCRAKAP